MGTALAEMARQAARLRQAYPDGRATLRLGRLTWTTTITPTPASRTYNVTITYDGVCEPRVWVRSPALEPDEEGKLPHIYPGGDLCLCRAGDWAVGDPIDSTTVPWTSEWLAHYEIWKTTGTWTGSGGNHTYPAPKPTAGRPARPKRKRRRR